MVIGLMLAACGQPEVNQVVVTPTAVSADAPTPTPLPTGVVILADGVVKAAQPTLPLAFEIGGKLLTVNVAPGDVVAAGDLVATLADDSLQEAMASAALQVAQAETGLAQAQAELDRLLTWEPDELAVVLAEANLAAATAALENAQTSDAAAGNSLTAASVNIEQAERALADAQAAYNTAFDPGREWELNDPWRADYLKAEREGATRSVQFAEEQLQVARASYALAAAGLNNDTAVNAQAGVVSAQQALIQAQKGPTAAQVETARLTVTQAEITLQQAQLSLAQAEQALADARLPAPVAGTVLAVAAVPGTLVGAGTPIVTLLDMTQMEFHTTNLSERDLAQIEPGQMVQVTLKTYPNDVLIGSVARIGLQAEGVVGDAATFPVIITLEATTLDIRPGMTGRVEIGGR